MGHGAFEGGYKKPSIRLHAIIFLTIIGVSVFLSTQVEKSKNNTRVEALKIPVPIDSVFVNESSSDTPPQVQTPKLADTSQAIKEPEVEYHFEDSSSLANIDEMLAKADGVDEQLEVTEVQPATTSKSEPAEESDVATEAVENSSREKDVAIMVTDEEPQTSVKDTQEFDLASQEKPVKTTDSKLDAVYELQQDRFLETLAKTASVKKEETIEVKRMKEAMRSDRPLTLKSTVKTEPATTKDKTTLVKVATTDTNGVLSASEKNSDESQKSTKVVVAKTSTPENGQVSKSAISSKALEEISLTKGELNNVLTQFTRSYNRGDIKRLMALFDENAITNDQKNKPGIKAEYDELFKTTSNRQLTIRNIQWKLGKDKATGDAKFTVTVQPKGSNEAAQIQGNIEILAIKQDQGVFIKQLLHQVGGQ